VGAKGKRKILHVVHGFPPECRGGTESVVARVAEAQAARGHAVTVLFGTMQVGEATTLERVDGPIAGVTHLRLRKSGLFVDQWDRSDDSEALDLIARSEAADADVVHVHQWIRLTRHLVRWARSLGKTVCVTLHDATVSCPIAFRVREDGLCRKDPGSSSCFGCAPTPFGMDETTCRDALDVFVADMRAEVAAADAVVVPTRAHAAFLAPWLPAEVRPIVVAHPSLESAPRRVHSSTVPADSPIRVLHFGHLNDVKGVPLLYEAMGLLAPSVRSALRLDVYGTAADPRMRARLDALKSGLPIYEHGPYVPSELDGDRHDVVVIPSRASESWSFVLDEAFAMSLPAIVPACGALEERIGAAGFVYPPDSVEGLASILEMLVRDRSQLDRARASIPGDRGVETHVDALDVVYGDARPKAPIAEPGLWAGLERRSRAALRRASMSIVEARGRVDAEIVRYDDLFANFKAAEAGVSEARSEISRLGTVLDGFRESVRQYAARCTELEKWVASLREGTEDGGRSVDRLLELERTLNGVEAALADREGELRIAERRLEFETARATESSVRAEAESRRAETEVFARHDVERTLHAALASTADLARRLVRVEADARLASDALRVERAARRDVGELVGHLEGDLRALRSVIAKQEREVVERAADIELLTTSQRALSARLESLAREAIAKDADLARAFHRESELKDVLAFSERRRRDVSDVVAAERATASSLQARVSADAARIRHLESVVRETKAEADAARALYDGLRAETNHERERVIRSEEILGAAFDGERLDPESASAWARKHAEAVAELDALRRAIVEDRGASAALKARVSTTSRRPKVLFVVHDFLPYHAAGSEIYTYQLAKALSKHVDVHLAFCENRPERPQYETREGTFDGLPFTEVVHHDAFPTFGATYEDPEMDRVFDGILRRVRPDVVHVQHLKFWGLGVLGRARKAGCRVFYTLHEYMAICPRDGQMRRPDGERCELPVPSTCADCITHVALSRSSAGRLAGSVLRRAVEAAPDALKEVGNRVARRWAIRGASPGSHSEREAAIRNRLSTTQEAFRAVDMFFAPSRFLRERFLASGIVPSDRIVWSPYGQDVERFPKHPKTPSERLRVGYLGTISSYKGLGVLIEALEALSAYPVEGRIHGALEIFPDYTAHLRATIRNPRIALLGRFDNRDVARLLADIDVLVVPSLWWENAPLTIHEAFLSKTPVVTSDIGGMKELVQHGVNGLHFKAGDAADLASVLRSLALDRASLRTLEPDPSIVRDIREDALSMLARYSAAVSASSERAFA